MPLLLVLLLSVNTNSPQLSISIPADPKSEWMAALHQCENPDNVEKVWDTNNQWSYGKYQWQMRSWLNYSKQGATKENIGDPDMQDKITRYVLDKGGWRNWYNCSLRTGLNKYYGTEEKPQIKTN